MKKQIQKQLVKIQSMIERIEEYNEYLNENSYSVSCLRKQLSYDVKLHNTCLCDDEVSEALSRLYPDMQPASVQEVMEEFNDDRLTGIVYHFYQDLQEDFISLFWLDENEPNKAFIKDWEIGFYGRGGGHLCLGSIDSFELDVCSTEVNMYPIWKFDNKFGMQWSFNDDDIIEQFKDQLGVTSQKELYKILKEDLKGDLLGLYEAAIANQKTLEQLEQRIKDFKAGSRQSLIQTLESEIEGFVEDNFSIDDAIERAEKGDYSKLQHINTIENNVITTNYNAKVPEDKAKVLVQMILKGDNVEGLKIGAYTINRVEKKEKDTYVKIGCHLLSLNETIKQLSHE